MKKIASITGLIALCCVAQTQSTIAQEATNVSWYILPTTLPDTTTPEFGTARDNWLTALSMGIAPTTASRLTGPTAIEVRDCFDVGDICVATAAGTKLWRGTFDPSGVFAGMTGMRVYGTAIGVAEGGQLKLSGISYRALCDRIPALNNQSSFDGLTYSVSRIGIRKGSDGVLFTADDEIVKSGSGESMVDAVVLIGARIGAVANNANNVATIDNAVTADGAKLTFEYFYNNSSKGQASVMLYPLGKIPNNTNRWATFKTPNGMLFTIVGPPGSGPVELLAARNVLGPWTSVTVNGTEGSSVFHVFTRNPTNDMGFVKINGMFQYPSAMQPMAIKAVGAFKDGPVLPAATDDLDQDS